MAELLSMLRCLPSGNLFPEATAPEVLIASFGQANAEGLIQLAIGKEDMLDPAAKWVRGWSSRYLRRLCQTRDAAEVPPPTLEETELHLLQRPPLLGSEYIDTDLLLRWWSEMREWTQAALVHEPQGMAGLLKKWSPDLLFTGRVTFHLAENKQSEEKPFAFLATYSEQLSASGQPQHVPLGRALKALSKSEDQPALQALLGPVRSAAARSTVVRQLLNSQQLFRALAWTPAEAFSLLQDLSILEECGLVVRLPDWWKARKPARPAISVTIDSPAGEKIGVQALCSFDVRATLGGEELTPEEWKRICVSPAGLVNLRGQWVEVDGDRLQSIAAHWRKIQHAHAAGTISFHEGMRWLAGLRPRAEGREPLKSESSDEWTEVAASERFKDQLKALLRPAPIMEVPGLRASLRPYQSRGVAWLHRLCALGLGACLADDMGLGKTLQVIGLLCLEKAQFSRDKPPSIIVVPASLISNWRNEFHRFAPHLRLLSAHPAWESSDTLTRLQQNPQETVGDYDVVLTTYGRLQRSDALLELSWNLAVLDEAQAIKNPATLQSQMTKQLKAHARVALTGTPVENKLADLWSLFDFLNPGLLGSATEFTEAVRQLASTGTSSGYAPIRRLIQPYLLRRLKTDRAIITDLPAKIEVDVRCCLSRKQAVLYGKIVSQLRDDLARTTEAPLQRSGLILSYLTQLKQVCNHPSHWSGDGRFVPQESGKFTQLREIAEQLAERQERCLIFTQYREMTTPLAGFLTQIFGTAGLVLHGGTPVRERGRIVEGFQREDGPPFFVLTVKAGGVGLNLTKATHVIHFDRWWNPAVESQATDRAYRIGQRNNVLVHRFVCPGTVEERIHTLLRQKQGLAEEVLLGDSNLPALLAAMTREELLDLVQLDLRSAML